MDTSALQHNAAIDNAQACNGEMTFKDIQGHRYYIGGRGSPKVTGNVTTQYSAYDFLYSTLIETIRLSFLSYSELFCQKSHILTYPPAFGPCLLWLPVNGWLDQVATLYGGIGLIPDQIVLDGGPNSPSQKKGDSSPPTFRPMSIVAKQSPISATAELLCKVDTHGVFLIMQHATYRYNQLAGGGYIAEGQMSFPYAT